jgi:hypothetical protein
LCPHRGAVGLNAGPKLVRADQATAGTLRIKTGTLEVLGVLLGEVFACRRAELALALKEGDELGCGVATALSATLIDGFAPFSTLSTGDAEVNYGACGATETLELFGLGDAVSNAVS